MRKEIKDHILAVLSHYAESSSGREEENARINNEAMSILEADDSEEYFVVTRLHRDDFEHQGFDASGLTDAEMLSIASDMGDSYVENGGYWEGIDYHAEERGLPKIENHDEA